MSSIAFPLAEWDGPIRVNADVNYARISIAVLMPNQQQPPSCERRVST